MQVCDTEPSAAIAHLLSDKAKEISITGTSPCPGLLPRGLGAQQVPVPILSPVPRRMQG